MVNHLTPLSLSTASAPSPPSSEGGATPTPPSPSHTGATVTTTLRTSARFAGASRLRTTSAPPSTMTLPMPSRLSARKMSAQGTRAAAAAGPRDHDQALRAELARCRDHMAEHGPAAHFVEHLG